MIELYTKDPRQGWNEATQEDIDQWNLERGGGSIYFVINRHGLPDKTAITKLVSIHTHTAVMSAPQEIVVERDDSLTEAILKALKELETGIPAAQIDAVRDTVKSHNAERGEG